MTRKSQIIVIIIALAVLILALAFIPVPKRPEAPAQKLNIQDVSANKPPEYFPTDLPIDPQAKIIRNYNVTTPDGRLQATRIFENSRSVESNFHFYKEFLLRNKWLLLAEVNDPVSPDHKALFAQGAGGILNINISKAPTAGASIVDLSLVVQPPR